MFPVLGFIGDTPIVSYYVFNIIAIAAGFIVLFWNMLGFDKTKRDKTFFFAFLIFLPFFFGARAGSMIDSVMTNMPQCFSKNILLGPFSIWWGLGLSCLLAVPIAKLIKVNVWETADLFAMSIAMGGVFARVACLLNGCCFGIPAPETYPFAVFYPYGSYPSELFGSGPIYPPQLFESLSWLAIFILLIIRNRYKAFQGELIIIMGFLYAIARFIIEFYRYHETPGFPSQGQLLSLIILIVSTLVWILKKTKESH